MLLDFGHTIDGVNDKGLSNLFNKLTNIAIRLFNYARSINFIRDKWLYNEYIKNNKIRKLHIGCGRSLIKGWLNTDYYGGKDIMRLDATKKFPFKDNEFDYIFSEHMIEHISYNDATKMLKECFRILKPGGKIRISTPDIRKIITLFNPKTETHKSYIEWSIENWCCNKYPKVFSPAFVVNNYVRDWGHQFIYDIETLELNLSIAGFVDIPKKTLSISESSDVNLSLLENEARMPPGFLEFETITLEGLKP
ncbi:class I SAM-dependent methyltransferase [Prochlorococcus sp. MIT 1341]|uniref:class I SAM-dependent methyltransferase n=1 Tax=Prochlorococcus sp. MIT 1341 TaxID=3096221 RepID=UPI002A764922|nr:methyltransferase domain-containing protein [Prochlorococcus sp. MIT 1341]